MARHRALRMERNLMIMKQWKGRKEFLLAQAQVLVVLGIAYVGDEWTRISSSYILGYAYDYGDYWFMNTILFLYCIFHLKHNSNGSVGGVQLLSRAQTDEWKGWMMWAYILHRYFHVRSVRNETKVFVSAYVWMTGFSNFLYFNKTQDFSVGRMVRIWLRMNYFPILLGVCLPVDFSDYYIVHLCTFGFFVTMATCYIAHCLKRKGYSHITSNVIALVISLLANAIVYETSMWDIFRRITGKYSMHFELDMYSAWVGMLSGLLWYKFIEYMQWAHAHETPSHVAIWGQRFVGVSLIGFWYYGFGYMPDQYDYNLWNPYVFWIPVAGWLILRNSSKYLTEVHCTTLEFFGKIAWEAFVLHFHVFLCRGGYAMPLLIPGIDSGTPGFIMLANTYLCGVIFVHLAMWVRTITKSTSKTLVELMTDLLKHNDDQAEREDNERLIETSEVDEKNPVPPQLECV